LRVQLMSLGTGRALGATVPAPAVGGLPSPL
jgi:hypothetical protein